MTHEERLAAARAFRQNVIAERDTLREQLREKTREALDAMNIAERWRARAEMTLWAELSSGASVAVGDRVRYMLRTYECIKAHSKALTRSPLSLEYWQEVE